MKKTKSSKRWLQEHFSDFYVKRANKEGYRARSVYKLQEIVERYKIIKHGSIIIDLGAAPGSWSDYAVKMVGSTGKVFALDILSIQPIVGVEFIQGDFTDATIQEIVIKKIGTHKVDAVLSDMAPNMSGNEVVDQLRVMHLVETALEFAVKVIKSNGIFLTKVFQGVGFDQLLQQFKHYFKEVKIIKPQASRARSAEIYILAQQKK
jgi:23S rRNA (uridine2552-2'-O)-methyltransferase